MADPCGASWPIGSFVPLAGVGRDLRRSVDPFGVVWWPADAVGCPTVLGPTFAAAAFLVLVFKALDPEAPTPEVIIAAVWNALGFTRVSAWNGGGSD
jgi:hypothetical protein